MLLVALAALACLRAPRMAAAQPSCKDYSVDPAFDADMGGCTYWFDEPTCTMHALCPDCADR